MIKISKVLFSSNTLNHFSIIAGVKYLTLIGIASMILSLVAIVPSYAQICYDCDGSSSKSNAQQNQVQLTDKGSIKVGFYTDPEYPNTANQTKFSISFVNKDSNMIQQHIDYKVFIKKGTDQIFGVPFTHTAQGSVTVPFQFTDAGTYQVVVEVDGILFQAIPPETATFTVGVESSSVPEFPTSTAIILVIGITSIIALSARSRLIPTN
ncbi:MAG: PEFG-CTERM sorting domain-containing protein [Thaumarchaeota archaeon]|nr:PEFG-CTERM sorting domain-containing protein [Nitrososphaerota archaeon]